jgi:alpha-L-fucosidase
VRNYFDQYIAPLAKEIIDRFDPDGLYMDGEWCALPETLHSREVAAYLYNRAEGRKEVCTDDRYGIDTRSQHGDIYMNEFYSSKSLDHPWEALRGLSNSFAYNHEDTDKEIISSQALVEFFVDTISHNGNLNLVVGPDPTGKIPDLQVDRLKALGRWIKVNAEAVYGSRVLAPYSAGSVCYTRSKDGRFAYAICKKWPGRRLQVKGVHAEPGAKIQMLGVTEPLGWTQTKSGLTIQIPDTLQDEKARPCEYAWVVRIPVQR